MSNFYIYSIVIAGLLAVSIPVFIIAKQNWKKRIENVFGGRQELNERDFYERYFESKEIPFYVVKKLREILEEVLEADLSRLSAEDDFSKNLNFFWQEDSLADVEIFEKIEDEFAITLTQTDLDLLETMSVTNIVNMIWKKIQERENT